MALVLSNKSWQKNTTPLGIEIVRIAERWANLKCVEIKANAGPCIDDVQQMFSGRVIAEAYCAKFVWIVIQEACEKMYIKNRLPKTASAKGMLDGSIKNNMVVQGKNGIAPGTVFARKSGASGGSGWHVGIVHSWDNDKFYTVEGNNDDKISYFHYEWEDIPKKDFWFIQTHRMSENFQYVQKTVTETVAAATKAVQNNPLPLIVGGAVIIGGIYYLSKRKKAS